VLGRRKDAVMRVSEGNLKFEDDWMWTVCCKEREGRRDEGEDTSSVDAETEFEVRCKDPEGSGVFSCIQ